jgi:hypothetical protein
VIFVDGEDERIAHSDGFELLIAFLKSFWRRLENLRRLYARSPRPSHSAQFRKVASYQQIRSLPLALKNI